MKCDFCRDEDAVVDRGQVIDPVNGEYKTLYLCVECAKSWDEENSLNEVLTVSEAAELMGVTDRHVRRLCEAKKIAARKSADGTWIVGKRGAQDYMKGMAD